MDNPEYVDKNGRELKKGNTVAFKHNHTDEEMTGEITAMSRMTGQLFITLKTNTGIAQALSSRTNMFDQIRAMSASLAGKYKRLSPENMEIADRGIIRHFAKCRKLGCDTDVQTIFEIVNDARKGRAVYEENDRETAITVAAQQCHSSMLSAHHVHVSGNKLRW